MELSSLKFFFNCEDTAQQVLMYICLSFCRQVGILPFLRPPKIPQGPPQSPQVSQGPSRSLKIPQGPKVSQGPYNVPYKVP